MARISIKEHLARPYRNYLILAVGALVLVSLGLAWQALSVSDWWLCGYVGLFGLLLLGIIVVAVWRLVRIDDHPDLVALRRYGELDVLLPQIEEELSTPGQLVRIGEMPKSFLMTSEEGGELDFTEVWIAPTWLIHVVRGAIRMHFFRLDSLVLVYPEENKVVLADVHGVHVEVSGTDAGRARLLAEILVRVPWALNHFDRETQKTWTENRQEIIAEVAQRRQTIQEEQTPRSTE